MKKLLASVVLVGSMFTGVAFAQDRIPTPRIAVVNPSRVFTEMQETKDQQTKIEKDGNRFNEEAKTRQADINKLVELRNQLKQDTPQYQEKTKELVQKSIDFQAWQQITRDDLARRQKVTMFSLYIKIQAAVEQVAKKNNLDLVVAQQGTDLNPEMVSTLNIDQLRMLINSQNLMFNSGKSDISTEVIAMLNLAYLSGPTTGPTTR